MADDGRLRNRRGRQADREESGGGGRGRITGDCVAIELSLLVASNSCLIKSLNPPHFKAPTL